MPLGETKTLPRWQLVGNSVPYFPPLLFESKWGGRFYLNFNNINYNITSRQMQEYSDVKLHDDIDVAIAIWKNSNIIVQVLQEF